MEPNGSDSSTIAVFANLVQQDLKSQSTMQDMDPQSTRAQFTQVTTPGEPDTANVSNHLPSPSMALELDTPRAVEVVTGPASPRARGPPASSTAWTT